MEHFPIGKAADAIIAAYAFGQEGGGRDPWYPTGKSRY
jgi:hypothetical protein